MHDKNGSKLTGSWRPTGYNTHNSQSLVGNRNQSKMSFLKLYLKLGTSFSFHSSTPGELRMAPVTPRWCYANRIAHARCLVAGVLNLSWAKVLSADIHTVRNLAPFSSLQIPSSAPPQLRDGVAGWWTVTALLFQQLLSVHGCLVRGLIRQNEVLCVELEQENLHSHLSKCHATGNSCYQDLLLRIGSIKSTMCLRFSRCCINIIHFGNSQTDQPLLRLWLSGVSLPVRADLTSLMFAAERSTRGLGLRLWRLYCKIMLYNTQDIWPHLRTRKPLKVLECVLSFELPNGIGVF